MCVSIRKFDEKDIPYKVKWINDEKNNRYLHYDLPLKEDETLAWFRKVKDRTDRMDFTITYNDEPVGLIGLLNIDKKNKKAEYYICVGEETYKGKGVAYIASKLLIDYASNKLKLSKLYLYTEVENIPAQKLFEKIGFRKEGLLRNDLIYNGRKIDRYVYGLDLEGDLIETKIVNIANEGFGLTPIQRLAENLNNNSYYIKRDDLFPISFGGNKARKAILFFKDLKEKKCNCVVTYGTSNSNHCRVIANIAASENIPCYIISPSETKRATYNSKMLGIFGTTVIQCPVAEVKATIERKLEELEDEGLKPYFIEGGGHGNLGTKAYVDAYQEIIDFEKENNTHFDYIFHPSGTGTTQAGLICGRLIYGGNSEIIGISIARKNPYGKEVVCESVDNYLSSIAKEPISIDSINFVDDYVLDGYGTYNDNTLQTLEKVLIRDTIPMDPIYTAKAYWGMKEYIKKNQITGKNVLFIHTGGSPLFFDNLEALINEE